MNNTPAAFTNLYKAMPRDQQAIDAAAKRFAKKHNLNAATYAELRLALANLTTAGEYRLLFSLWLGIANRALKSDFANGIVDGFVGYDGMPA